MSKPSSSLPSRGSVNELESRVSIETAYEACTRVGSGADVLVPDVRPARDELGQQVDAFARVAVDDAHAELAQPVDPALERPRLADDDAADAELPDQAAAVRAS